MAQEGTVHVLALFTAAPGKEEELEKALTVLIEPTRREAGCIRYDLTQGIGKPAEFAFIEEWESAEHLDAHSKTPHVREAGSKAATLLGAPASIERYRQIG
jgi:quinol monooxygenase YgiN